MRAAAAASEARARAAGRLLFINAGFRAEANGGLARAVETATTSASRPTSRVIRATATRPAPVIGGPVAATRGKASTLLSFAPNTPEASGLARSPMHGSRAEGLGSVTVRAVFRLGDPEGLRGSAKAARPGTAHSSGTQTRAVALTPATRAPEAVGPRTPSAPTRGGSRLRPRATPTPPFERAVRHGGGTTPLSNPRT